VQGVQENKCLFVFLNTLHLWCLVCDMVQVSGTGFLLVCHLYKPGDRISSSDDKLPARLTKVIGVSLRTSDCVVHKTNERVCFDSLHYRLL